MSVRAVLVSLLFLALLTGCDLFGEDDPVPSIAMEQETYRLPGNTSGEGAPYGSVEPVAVVTNASEEEIYETWACGYLVSVERAGDGPLDWSTHNSIFCTAAAPSRTPLEPGESVRTGYPIEEPGRYRYVIKYGLAPEADDVGTVYSPPFTVEPPSPSSSSQE